jgi:hypothetical protein
VQQQVRSTLVHRIRLSCQQLGVKRTVGHAQAQPLRQSQRQHFRLLTNALVLACFSSEERFVSLDGEKLLCRWRLGCRICVRPMQSCIRSWRQAHGLRKSRTRSRST